MIAVVAGSLANKAGNGGNAWARLSWTRGLAQLGFETYFVEQLDAAAPPGGIGFFDAVMNELGDHSRAALLDADGAALGGGLEPARLRDVCERAALLVNLSGHLQIAELRRLAAKSVYVDDDPGYTQIWHASGALGDRLDGHDAHYTFGTRIGTRACPVPTDGIRWRPIRPPVVLSDWPQTPIESSARVSTVASWRGPYGPVTHAGVSYGAKSRELRKVAELPTLFGRTLEIALQIDPTEQAAADGLRAAGWTVVDPALVAGEPRAFRDYVQGSAAEFSVAQEIYVGTSSGWFSDRTTRYLASGRPAIVQDTGFSAELPVGAGLISFRTVDEALAGLRSLECSYDEHARAARELAEAYFDSSVVLRAMLEDVL